MHKISIFHQWMHDTWKALHEGLYKGKWPTIPHPIPSFFLFSFFSSLSHSLKSKRRRRKKKEEEEEEEEATAQGDFVHRVLVSFFFSHFYDDHDYLVSYLVLVHDLVGGTSKGKEKELGGSK